MSILHNAFAVMQRKCIYINENPSRSACFAGSFLCDIFQCFAVPLTINDEVFPVRQKIKN